MNRDRSPASDSIAYWNEDAGPRWARHADGIDLQLEKFLEPLCRVSGVAEGERVLDVGCGAGALSLCLAEKVSPGGRVTGVDVARDLLALARRRAGERGGDLVEFRLGDAEVEPFERGTFDRALSRFGVMFFGDSVAAFRNLRRALRPGGSLTFVCWAAVEDNPWMAIPKQVVDRYAEEIEPPDPDGPGPFRFRDAARVRALCNESGFDPVTIDRLDGPVLLGGKGSLERTLDFVMEIGPASRVRQAADGLQRAVRDELRRALEPYACDRGVKLESSAWFVHAEF